MKKIFLVFGLFLLAKTAEAKITILACEPEWASLAQEIVKNKAEIKIATSADQDPRNIEVKTVLATMARNADLLFCSGGDLESKWFPTLIARSYNMKIMSNESNVLLALDYVEKPKFSEKENADKVNKDRAVKSNARVHLNPHNITKIAAEFTRRIKLIDAVNANFYQKSFDDFSKKWNEAIKKWEEKAAFLRGVTFVAEDDSWDFLANWLGLKIITLVDVQTGAKPNVVSLHKVVNLLKKNPAEAIIFARFENKKNLLWLRDKTKIRMILLPFTVGGAANSGDLFQLFETTISSLSTDCSSGTCKSLSVQKQTDSNQK